MSEEQLQELSKQAARALPKLEGANWYASKVDCNHGGENIPTEFTPAGTVGFGDNWDRRCWLHESTEACTEIMVRVLWPADQTVHGFKSAGGTYTARAIFDPANEDDANDVIGSSYANEPDPLLAYRVAVLRALIALKGKP